MLQKFREENYLNDKNYLDYINCIEIQKFKLEINIVNILLNENRINNKTYEK